MSYVSKILFNKINQKLDTYSDSQCVFSSTRTWDEYIRLRLAQTFLLLMRAHCTSMISIDCHGAVQQWFIQKSFKITYIYWKSIEKYHFLICFVVNSKKYDKALCWLNLKREKRSFVNKSIPSSTNWIIRLCLGSELLIRKLLGKFVAKNVWSMKIDRISFLSNISSMGTPNEDPMSGRGKLKTYQEYISFQDWEEYQDP